jgi:hypothetical protein
VLFVCCLIVVILPPGENPFAVNNNNKNNNKPLSFKSLAFLKFGKNRIKQIYVATELSLVVKQTTLPIHFGYL